MRETPGVKPHEEPLLIMEGGVVPVSGGEAVLMATDANALKPSIEMATGDTITRGKSVYLTFCAQCHGNNYDGQGTVGQSFQPLPANLRSNLVQTKTEGEFFKSVSYGVQGRPAAGFGHYHFICGPLAGGGFRQIPWPEKVLKLPVSVQFSSRPKKAMANCAACLILNLAPAGTLLPILHV